VLLARVGGLESVKNIAEAASSWGREEIEKGVSTWTHSRRGGNLAKAKPTTTTRKKLIQSS
jgi:hypothetical protein